VKGTGPQGCEEEVPTRTGATKGPVAVAAALPAGDAGSRGSGREEVGRGRESKGRNKCTVLKGKWKEEGRRTHKRGDGGDGGRGLTE